MLLPTKTFSRKDRTYPCITNIISQNISQYLLGTSCIWGTLVDSPWAPPLILTTVLWDSLFYRWESWGSNDMPNSSSMHWSKVPAQHLIPCSMLLGGLPDAHHPIAWCQSCDVLKGGAITSNCDRPQLQVPWRSGPCRMNGKGRPAGLNKQCQQRQKTGQSWAIWDAVWQ